MQACFHVCTHPRTHMHTLPHKYKHMYSIFSAKESQSSEECECLSNTKTETFGQTAPLYNMQCFVSESSRTSEWPLHSSFCR